MIESHISTTDLTNRERRLADYYANGQSDYSTEIASSLRELIQVFRNKQRTIRNYCKRLTLHASGAETTSDTGDKSDEDIVERTRLVVVVSAISGSNNTWTLEGTNDSASETWSSITLSSTIANKSSTGTYTQTFNDTYKYYRVNYSGTSATYLAYLVETSFELAHTYLALYYVYNQLRGNVDDMWERKSEEYWQLFNDETAVIVSSYDVDESGAITTGEETQITRASFSR